jgi:fatty acid desaturase
VPVELNFIALLGLLDVQTLLTNLDDQRLAVALLIILINVIGGGLLVAVTIMLIGWSYNLLAMLTGGLEVELRE